MPINSLERFPILDRKSLAEVYAELSHKLPALVDFFLEDTARYIARMEQALAHEDMVALVPPAHLTKSASRQLGLMRLGEVASNLEKVARQSLQGRRDPVAISESISQLRNVFEQTCGEVRTRLRSA